MQLTAGVLISASHGLVRVCPPMLAAKVRSLLRREDDYRAPGKPACDWADPAAREALVDALVRDAYRAGDAPRGERLDQRVAHEAVWIYQGGRGVIEDNDLTGNTKGAWDIPKDSLPNVKRSGNRT